jgi:Family of unknown function (DUF5906)
MTPLFATAQWIVVLLVPLANGKTDKLPVDYRTAQVTQKDGNGAHNPAIWTTYEHARDLARQWGPEFTVGFVLTKNDPFFCLDIDGALQADGTWSPLSQQLCASLPGTCIEISQSGRGLHVWGHGYVPPHSMKRVDLGIEFYTERRFIAIGHSAVGDMTLPCPTVAQFAAAYFPPRETVPVHGDGPDPAWRGPTDDAELIRRMLQSKSARSTFGGGASAADLWERNVEVLARAYPPDRSSSEPYDGSSADAALAQHLAFWTGKDAPRIDRLMRQSGLVREKYDRDDYMARTIANACAMQREVLQDKPVEPPPGPSLPAPAENLGTGEEPGEAPLVPSAAAPGLPAISGMPSMTPVTGNTFVSPAEQVQMFNGCVYVTEIHRVLVPGGHLLNPDRFRSYFGGYTFAMDARNERTTRNAWEAFTESQVLRAPRVDGTCFRPQLPYGSIVRDAGRVRVNTYWPVEVPREEGDITPFVRHIRKLFPKGETIRVTWRGQKIEVGRDGFIIICYMAAAVQYQGVKFQWAPLIQGVEGNGKTFLSRCVAEAIGRRYVHWPKASKLAKQFNNWMVGKTFYAVEDIHTSENVDVIEELKPMITGGDGLEIEAKGVDQVSAEICGNFIFNTNHKNALKKTRNDRRFCPLFCAQQTIDDLVRDGMDGDYMSGLYEWAQTMGGFAFIAEFLHTFEIPDEFNPAKGCQRAPVTTSTDEAIQQSHGRVEQEILEAVAQGLPGFCGGFISSIAVDKLIDRLGRGGAVAPNRRREMMRTLGYDWHPGLPDGRVHNIVVPDGGKPRLYVCAGHPTLGLTQPAEIARAYTAAQGVK